MEHLTNTPCLEATIYHLCLNCFCFTHNVRVSRELQPVIFSNELLQNMETQFWSETNNSIHNSSLRIFHNKVRLICFSCSLLAGWVSSVASNYEECLRTGQVISDVFCLPDTYRKDVPPHSKMLKPADK